MSLAVLPEAEESAASRILITPGEKIGTSTRKQMSKSVYRIAMTKSQPNFSNRTMTTNVIQPKIIEMKKFFKTRRKKEK